MPAVVSSVVQAQTLSVHMCVHVHMCVCEFVCVLTLPANPLLFFLLLNGKDRCSKDDNVFTVDQTTDSPIWKQKR